jgi:hypothetical protein
MVENQIAMGDATAALATFKRLMDEGLDRHEAIHAVGSVLMGIVFDVIRKVDDEANINAKYGRELAALTAASWRERLISILRDNVTNPCYQRECLETARRWIPMGDRRCPSREGQHEESNEVQKIHEARQRLAALDRELTGLVRIVGDNRALKKERGRILQERLRAFLELLQLLELAEMPPAEMGSA